MAQHQRIATPRNLHYMKVANLIRSGDPSGIQQIANILNRDAIQEWHDDFEGDLIADEWTAISATSTAAVANSLLTVTQSITADTYYGIVGALGWYPTKSCFMQARFNIPTATTDQKIEIGFTDSVSNTGLVNVLANVDDFTTFTGADGAVLVWDTTSNNTNWCACAPRPAALADRKVVTDTAPETVNYHTVGVRIDNTDATFYIDGRRVAVITGATTAATALTPTVFHQSRGAARVLNLDYIWAIQSRRT